MSVYVGITSPDRSRAVEPGRAGMRVRLYMSTRVRLLHYSEVKPDGCWIWLGGRDNTGYGRLTFEGVHDRAHRVSYATFVGPIPDGLFIDHLCRVPACINPAHLEPVTNKENCDRGIKSSRKTHCDYGHELTPENTYNRSRGTRECRRCGNERDRRRYWSIKANREARANG
jgi:hypothetical protein